MWGWIMPIRYRMYGSDQSRPLSSSTSNAGAGEDSSSAAGGCSSPEEVQEGEKPSAGVWGEAPCASAGTDASASDFVSCSEGSEASEAAEATVCLSSFSSSLDMRAKESGLVPELYA